MRAVIERDRERVFACVRTCVRIVRTHAECWMATVYTHTHTHTHAGLAHCSRAINIRDVGRSPTESIAPARYASISECEDPPDPIIVIIIIFGRPVMLTVHKRQMISPNNPDKNNTPNGNVTNYEPYLWGGSSRARLVVVDESHSTFLNECTAVKGAEICVSMAEIQYAQPKRPNRSGTQ